ncbi:DUF1917-domain-containing protein [Rhizoclosmatium globosum]|uniref:DUF1917-domain-containing protein n=1 Tax=Rhizoclosmatium globosum TaxID=329046 RepID=A0A1Y2BXE7_9FUNG|nr:DUF1917-domain-containing protein [Rhizoclosmatium globosum]|eukprot:ORY39431.1 DUF1917-domain-containing protein [Rhizoclosmatium globosum]
MCRAIRPSTATATATVSESVSPSVFVSESTANLNLNLNLSTRALDEAARLARIEAKHPAPAPASEQLPQLLSAIPSLPLTLTPTPTPIQNYATPSAYQHADRIHWNNAVPISRYISEFRPSAVSIHQANWICVKCPIQRPSTAPSAVHSTKPLHSYESVKTRMKTQIQQTNRVSAAQKEQAVADILDIATWEGKTCGKWMLFVYPRNVDYVWGQICAAVVEGRLGWSAKVATLDPKANTFLICVYCQDFNDVIELERVLREMKSMGFNVTSGFKPDIFTELGIYNNNEWRIPATIHEKILRKIFSTAPEEL